MLNRLQYLLCRIAGFEPFDVQKHGIIAPANWHGAPAPARQKERPNEYDVVITADQSIALSKKFQPADGDTMTFEAPVKSGNSADTSGRVPTLTYADLKELAKRNVSKAVAEKAKPLWCEGKTAAQIASAVGKSQRTIEGAIGAFNAALTQMAAVAVVND